jgi:MFS family permease
LFFMVANTAKRLLYLALGAMFVQQTFASIGRTLPLVIAPAIIEDLHIDPALVGVYVGAAALAALVFQLGCGSFIIRYGALRMSQVALVFLALGMALAAAGPLLFFLISAIIGGGGAATSTPASSHLLGRYSPPKQAPLVFSIKQTAVPAGLLLAGLLGPLMTWYWGWSGALLVTAGACFLFAVMLEPLRGEFDSDRVPSRSFHFSDFRTTLAAVLKSKDLRELSLACFAFNGLQTAFTSYYVLYLTALNYDLAAAGLMFAIAMVIAVPMRIFWGWLSSGRVSPRRVMAGLSLGMAASAVLMSLYGADWHPLLIATIATGMSATAMSWHGVLLSEAARLAPPGMRGAATGGVLSFGQVGAFILPVIYAAQLAITNSHGIGFLLCGVPALVVGIVMWRASRRVA